MNIELTQRQERFCHEYTACGNGTKAAIRAGFSTKTAASIAERLLRLPKIQARIKELQQEILGNLRLTTERVLRQLELIAFGTLEEIVTVENGRAIVQDTTTIHPDKLALIRQVKVNNMGQVSITIHNPLPALLELARITGLSGDFNVAIATLEKYGVNLKRRADGSWFVAE